MIIFLQQRSLWFNSLTFSNIANSWVQKEIFSSGRPGNTLLNSRRSQLYRYEINDKIHISNMRNAFCPVMKDPKIAYHFEYATSWWICWEDALSLGDGTRLTKLALYPNQGPLEPPHAKAIRMCTLPYDLCRSWCEIDPGHSLWQHPTDMDETPVQPSTTEYESHAAFGSSTMTLLPTALSDIELGCGEHGLCSLSL